MGIFANYIDVLCKLGLDLMEDTLANFDAVSDIKDLLNAFNRQLTNIISLATRCRVEATLVKNHKVAFVLLQLIGKDFDNFTAKVHLPVIFKVDISCLRQVDRVVKDFFWGFHDFLLPCCDLVIQISWHWCV